MIYMYLHLLKVIDLLILILLFHCLFTLINTSKNVNI